MATPNTRIKTWDIFNAFRMQQNNAYQERIPIATQDNFKEVNRMLTQYLPDRNAILGSVVNKIGLTKFQQLHWTNPFTEFKKGTVRYGESVEDVQLGLINAVAYEVDRESGEREIFGRKYIENSASYYKHNRADKYPITIDDMGGEIDRAFTSEYGVSDYISNVFAAQHNSAQWDEFQLMCNLINNYEENDGFYKVHVDDVTDEETAKALLESIRAYASELAFFDRRFNAAKMNTFANPEDLIIITTPQVKAKLDVQALAAVFNLDKAEVPARIVVVPEKVLRITGFKALLTTVNFFQVFDQLETTTSMGNPADLYTNYWLHIRQIISYSRFVPAIVFWTGEGSESVDIVYTPTAVSNLTFTNAATGETDTKLTRGELYEVTGSATVTVTPTGTEIAEFAKGIGFSLTGDQRSPRTQARNSSFLLVGHDETAPSLTLRVFSTLDPEVSKEQVVELEGDALIEWPMQIIDADDLVPAPDPKP